jgi:hypothetical protein
MDRSMPHRQRHLTALEIPSDHGIGVSRSVPTVVGHASTAELEPEPAPPSPPPSRPAPWTETVYISPSGRIFLPPGFDFEQGRPRTLTPISIRREPPSPRPEPYRARVVIGQVPRPRTITRESWVVPPHLQPGVGSVPA